MNDIIDYMISKNRSVAYEKSKIKPMRDDLMVQQQVSSIWQHMVAVICLNQTNRKIVKKILPKFFRRFPDEHSLLRADVETIADMLKDLGLKYVRSRRLIRMSEDILTWDGKDATQLFGIGKYGSDSYQIFWKNNIPDNIGDKELKRYVREEL